MIIFLFIIYIIGIFATSALMGYLDMEKHPTPVVLWPISVPILMIVFSFLFLMEKGYEWGEKWKQ